MAIEAFARPRLATALLTATATLTFAATGALAASSADSARATADTSSAPTRSSHDHSGLLGTPPEADVQPFESAKLSLTQAISSAQRENRGKPLAARFEVWHGKPVYLIRTYSANQVWETRIDANSGDQIGQPETVAKSELGPQLDQEITALNNSQTSLSDAVNKAERDGGKVIMARVKPVSGGASYDLRVVKDGRLRTAMVDAQSGQLR